MTMLASGVSLPGMRTGRVWRHWWRTLGGPPQKPTLFSGHYLRKRSTLDIGVLGYIGIVQHKEHSPEILSIPPGTLCISFFWISNSPLLFILLLYEFHSTYYISYSNFLQNFSHFITHCLLQTHFCLLFLLSPHCL